MTDPVNQPQPIIIKQETSPGTKVGIWVLVGLIGGPILLVAICCVGMLAMGVIGSAQMGAVSP